MMMTTPEFYEGAIEAVRSGRLAESEIDAPCARLLALKFRMGLFENPRRADLEQAAIEISRPDHRAVNLEAARQSLILLQNNGLLPLDAAQLKSIAVIGPNADDDLQQLGDWYSGLFAASARGRQAAPRENYHRPGRHPHPGSLRLRGALRARLLHH